MSALPERALTLWQPWAWLVATGVKSIENRPRGFSHKSFRGDFWIHAGVETAPQIAGFLRAVRLCAEILGDDFKIPDARTLAYGAIIGRATVVDVVPPRLSLLGRPDPAPVVPWHFHDQYGFRVEGAKLLAKPVPCRGFQGFWRVPAPVLEELREAV